MAFTPPPTVPYHSTNGYQRTAGDMCTYAGVFNVEMRPNDPFPASLRITGLERGRSAARFVAENVDTGVKYPIFMTDLLAIIQEHGILRGGIVTGTWQAGKRGANYGLRLVNA